MYDMTNPEDDKFGKDMDDTVDMMMTVMMMVIVMMFILPSLSGLQSTQAQSYYDSRSFEGQSDPRTLHATVKNQEIVLANPWVYASFTNYGPSTVQVSLNGSDRWFEIRVNEVVTADRIGAADRVYAVAYRATDGEAEISVLGDY